ncbi:MAG TPA: hypothetical protein VMV09_07780 [Candidatus Saccharimonadales bacterium]|nr:hypothetical protein [Candidatus Saccharimonadales bacterium]
MNDGDWNVIWALIRGGWPFSQLADPVTEAAWRVGLEDLSPTDLTDAVKAEVRLADRLPSVAAIRQAAGEISRDRRRATPKLETPMSPIPEEFQGDWQTVSQTLAKRREAQ